MRDENDWRIGDKITEGPDWRNSFRKPWDEHWTFGTAGKWEPIVRKVYRCHGNVIRVNIGHARGSFAITVNGKRYILNPACRNGGYRSNNNPDPKYQTDANGRFVNPKRSSGCVEILDCSQGRTRAKDKGQHSTRGQGPLRQIWE